jgi:hypothetical protein
MKLTMLLLLLALVSCTATEGKDVVGQDSFDTTGGGDVVLDGVFLDGQTETGAISVAGTLTLVDAPIASMDTSAYWIGLYPADFQQGDDPITHLLGIFSFAPGAGYTGTSISIPDQGNTFLAWNPEAENGPVLDYPYAATAGNYVVIVSLALDDSSAHTAAYYYATEVQIPSVPYTLDLGPLTLDLVPVE